MSRTFLIAALVLAIPGHAEWVRITSGTTGGATDPAIELFSNAGTGGTRRATDRLAELKHVLPDFDNVQGGPSSGRPLRVFLFDDESEFRRFTGNPVNDGFFQSGLERDYIVAYASEGISRVVAHEYVHFLTHSSGSLALASSPSWLTEGIAELYSNAGIEGEGDRAQWVTGAPIKAHMDLLREAINEGGWLDAEALQQRATDLGAHNLTGGDRQLATLYYAESWALTHMLRFRPEYRDGFGAFVAALQSELDENRAFQDAFGVTLEQALSQVPEYLDRLQAVRQPAPQILAATETLSEAISEVDSALLLSGLALRCGRLDSAAEYLDQARGAADPADPGAAAQIAVGEAILAQAQGQPDEARSALEAAAATGSTDARVYFTLAMIEQRSGASAARVGQLLERTVAVNPAFGEARLLLGVRATDDGDLDLAVEHLTAASSLMPGASHVWHALAFAQLRRGDLEAAQRAVIRARRTAQTLSETGMANALREAILRERQIGGDR